MDHSVSSVNKSMSSSVMSPKLNKIESSIAVAVEQVEILLSKKSVKSNANSLASSTMNTQQQVTFEPNMQTQPQFMDDLAALREHLGLSDLTEANFKDKIINKFDQKSKAFESEPHDQQQWLDTLASDIRWMVAELNHVGAVLSADFVANERMSIQDAVRAVRLQIQRVSDKKGAGFRGVVEVI